jgi:hypothetical protein
MAYDKLVVHGFHTHARFDESSNYVLRAKVTLEKRKEMIFKSYVTHPQLLEGLKCESK